MKYERLAAIVLLLTVSSLTLVRAQDDQGFTAQRDADIANSIRQLSNPDPLTRQRAAETLAQLSAVEQLKIVQGFRLQEKNRRARLAIDWALYRMGQSSALYDVVRELPNDTRRNQVVGYLSQLPAPDPLYKFFNRADEKTIVGLLEVLATIGNADTVDLIKGFTTSVDPGVSAAAQLTTRQITTRLALPTPQVQTRQRAIDEPE